MNQQMITSCSDVDEHLGRYQEQGKYPKDVRIYHFG